MPEHAWVQTQRPPSRGAQVLGPLGSVPFCCGEVGQAWFSALNHLPFPRCWLLSPAEYLPHPFITENLLFLLVFLLKTPAYLKPPSGSVVKHLPANAGDARDARWIPGWGRSLEEGLATPSSLLAWRISRTEETCRLLSMGSQKIRHSWATKQQQGFHTPNQLNEYWVLMILLLIKWYTGRQKIKSADS